MYGTIRIYGVISKGEGKDAFHMQQMLNRILVVLLIPLLLADSLRAMPPAEHWSSHTPLQRSSLNQNLFAEEALTSVGLWQHVVVACLSVMHWNRERAFQALESDRKTNRNAAFATATSGIKNLKENVLPATEVKILHEGTVDDIDGGLNDTQKTVLRQAYSSALASYPELSNVPIHLRITQGNSSVAGVKGRAIWIDQALLDYPELLRQELESEEFFHYLFRGMLRNVRTDQPAPTPEESAIEELYTDIRKIENFISMKSPDSQASLIAPLLNAFDHHDFYRIMLRALTEDRRRQVIDILRTRYNMEERTGRSLERLEIMNTSAYVPELVSFYQRSRTYDASITAYYNDHSLPQIGRALNTFREEFKSLRQKYNRSLRAAEDPKRYIDRMHESLKGQGAHWDLIVVTVKNEAMKEFLEAQFNRIGPALLPTGTQIRFIGRHVSMNNFDGTVSAMAKILGENIDNNGKVLKDLNLPPDPRILILHSAGDGGRNFPIAAVVHGNKGSIQVPATVNVGDRAEVLSSIAQAIRQFHQIAADTPRGTITVGTSDQIWIVSRSVAPTLGQATALQVFGNHYDLTRVVEDLVHMGLITGYTREQSGAFSLQTTKSDADIEKELQEFFKRAESDSSEKDRAPNLFQLIQLGQIVPSAAPNVKKMVEKPKAWLELRQLLDRGETNFAWWNHRYEIPVARSTVQLYRDCVGKSLNFSIDIEEAATTPRDVWLAKKLQQEKKKLTAAELADPEIAEKKWGWVYDRAQLALRTIFDGAIGYIEAGRLADFEDTGDNVALMRAYLRTPHNELYRALFDFKPFYDNRHRAYAVIASPAVEQAINAGTLTMDQSAMVIGSDISHGHIGVNCLVVDTFVYRLSAEHNSITWGLRGITHEHARTPANMILAEVVQNGLLTRKVQGVNGDPKVKGGLYDELRADVQSTHPLVAELLYGEAPRVKPLVHEVEQWYANRSITSRDRIEKAITLWRSHRLGDPYLGIQLILKALSAESTMTAIFLRILKTRGLHQGDKPLTVREVVSRLGELEQKKIDNLNSILPQLGVPRDDAGSRRRSLTPGQLLASAAGMAVDPWGTVNAILAHEIGHIVVYILLYPFALLYAVASGKSLPSFQPIQGAYFDTEYGIGSVQNSLGHPTFDKIVEAGGIIGTASMAFLLWSNPHLHSQAVASLVMTLIGLMPLRHSDAQKIFGLPAVQDLDSAA